MNMEKSGSEFQNEGDLTRQRIAYFDRNKDRPLEVLESLARFMSRQEMAKLLCYADAMRATEGVAGSILECGVYRGNGLMGWAKLSAALDPSNYPFKVIGFDTFEGNTPLTAMDKVTSAAIHAHEGGYKADSEEDLRECISIFDADRPLNHISKVELVRGDISETAEVYIKHNPHLLVRILSLSMNLHRPTAAALLAFLPRLTHGSVIVAFSLNSDLYPGATLAMLRGLDMDGG